MKKPNFKKQKQGITVSPLKTRNFLHELHPNLMASRNIIKKKLTTEEKKLSECLIYRLSDELLVSILQFLNPRDLVLSVQLACKDWRRITSDTRFWKLLESDNALDLWWKVCRTSCIVERRSKGKLYRGYLRTTRQPVTLRNIFLDVTNAGQDDGVPTSVLREVSYLANMQSEYVAEFLGAQVNGNQALICMELTPWNLKEYLRRFLYEENADKYYFKNNSWDKTVRYRIPLPEVKSIMYQILQSLNYIHHRGIMHRNLKSDNILITTQGTVKISDFALSKQCTIPHTVYTPEDPKERDRSGREARRLWYRPPELLCRKEVYSFEVDIWAAGCMLAEICLNEPLFNGETEIEQLFKIFRFTGCPDTDAFPGYNVGFPKWNRVEFKNVMANKQSKEFNHVCKVLVPNRESTFHKLVSIGSVIGPEGLDLLQKLLELDPSKRISAAQALRHPFFGQIPSICCTHVTYPSFTMPECQLLSYISSLREIELKTKFDFQYLKKQPNITEMMRAILIDWLVDVSVHFELLDETLHIAVALIDKTLSKVKTDRTRLQLIGVTCMKIAE
jgi:serine/threonine protein kinase